MPLKPRVHKNDEGGILLFLPLNVSFNRLTEAAVKRAFTIPGIINGNKPNSIAFSNQQVVLIEVYQS